MEWRPKISSIFSGKGNFAKFSFLEKVFWNLGNYGSPFLKNLVREKTVHRSRILSLGRQKNINGIGIQSRRGKKIFLDA